MLEEYYLSKKKKNNAWRRKCTILSILTIASGIKKKKLLLQEQTFYITIPNVHFVHTIFTLGVHMLHMMRQNVYEECIKGV